MKRSKLVLQFHLKAASIIYSSRISHSPHGQDSSSSISSHKTGEPTKAARWFMLDSGELPSRMRQEIEPWTSPSQQPARTPLTIHIYSDEGQQKVLLERWTFSLVQNQTLVNEDEMTTYKNLTLAARSLYCHLRLLPAHGFFLRHPMNDPSSVTLCCSILKDSGNSSLCLSLENRYYSSQVVNCPCGAEGAFVITVDYLPRQHLPSLPHPNSPPSSTPFTSTTEPMTIIPNYLTTTTAQQQTPKFSPTSYSPSPKPSPSNHQSNPPLPHPKASDLSSRIGSLSSSLGKSFGAMAAAIASSPPSQNWMQKPPRTPAVHLPSTSPCFSPTQHTLATQVSAAGLSTTIGSIASSLGRAGSAWLSSSPTSRRGFLGNSASSSGGGYPKTSSGGGYPKTSSNVHGAIIRLDPPEDSVALALASTSTSASPKSLPLSSQRREWMGQDFRALLPPPLVEVLTLPTPLAPMHLETLPLAIPIQKHVGFDAPLSPRRPLSPQLESHGTHRPSLSQRQKCGSTNTLAINSGSGGGGGGGLLAQSIRQHKQSLLDQQKAEELKRTAEDSGLPWVMRKLAPLAEAKDTNVSIGLFLGLLDEMEEEESKSGTSQEMDTTGFDLGATLEGLKFP